MIATGWGVEVVRAVAMPVVVLTLGLVLRRPIGAFLENIGARASKLSVGSFSVELTPASELRPDWRIEMGATAVDVRQLSPSGAFDSYADSLFQQFDDPNPIDYVVIDLGTGHSWLSSRLFLFAHLLDRMRGVRAFVFVHTIGSRPRQFLGLAAPGAIRWRLAREFPALEQAMIAAHAMTFGAAAPVQGLVQPIVVTDTGGVERWRAGQLSRTYLEALQAPTGPQLGPDWVALDRPPPEPPLSERATWLSGADIERILEPVLHADSIEERDDRDIDRGEQARAVLALTGDFVAVVRGGQFDRLLDRRAMLEQQARHAAGGAPAPR